MDAKLATLQLPEPNHSRARTGAERQRRYRVARMLRSVDLPASTVETLQAVRARTGLTNEQVLSRALLLLIANLDYPPSVVPSSPVLSAGGAGNVEAAAPVPESHKARATARMAGRSAAKAREKPTPNSKPEPSTGDGPRSSRGDVPGAITGAPADGAGVASSDCQKEPQEAAALAPTREQIGFDFDGPLGPPSPKSPDGVAASRKHHRA